MGFPSNVKNLKFTECSSVISCTLIFEQDVSTHNTTFEGKKPMEIGFRDDAQFSNSF